MALGVITLLIGVLVSQTLMRKTNPEAYGLLPDGDKTTLIHQSSAPQAVHKISNMTMFKDSRFWTLAICQGLAVSQLYVCALIYGFGYGSLAPILPLLVANRFGRHIVGSIYGLLTFFIGVGGAVSPVLGVFIYDHFGSYRYLWLINIFVLSYVALAVLTLKKGSQYTTTGS